MTNLKHQKGEAPHGGLLESRVLLKPARLDPLSRGQLDIAPKDNPDTSS